MKFRVGDKVRIIADTSDANPDSVGKIGVITDDTGVHNPGYPYTVQYGGKNDWTVCNDDELAPATPRIDPSIITRLNEVVTMLTRERIRLAAIRPCWNDDTPTEYENIVARIDAMTKVIEELTKEDR